MSEHKYLTANLVREVFDKTKFNETVDTTFSQLVTKPDPVFFDIDLATVNDFFILYDKFFYEIPKEGETESHRFLVKKSGEYIGGEELNDSIKILLEEIATLREENLELRKENVFILLQSTGQEVGSIEDIFGEETTTTTPGGTSAIGGGGCGSIGGGGISGGGGY